MTEPVAYIEDQLAARGDQAYRAGFDEAYRESYETAHAQARDEAYAEGVALERARITAILACPAATTHPTVVKHLALKTDFSVERIADFLAGLPPEQPHRDRLDECIAAAEAAATAAQVDAVGASLDAAVTRLLQTNRKAVN